MLWRSPGAPRQSLEIVCPNLELSKDCPGTVPGLSRTHRARSVFAVRSAEKGVSVGSLRIPEDVCALCYSLYDASVGAQDPPIESAPMVCRGAN